MKTIRWMCGHTRLDRIRDVVIRSKVGVTSMEDKMTEVRLRWFDHIRKSVNAPVKRCEIIVLPECMKC